VVHITTVELWKGISLLLSDRAQTQNWIFLCVRNEVAKMRLLASPCLSVCPYVRARETLKEFSWNLLLGSFTKDINIFKFWLKPDKIMEGGRCVPPKDLKDLRKFITNYTSSTEYLTFQPWRWRTKYPQLTLSSKRDMNTDPKKQGWQNHRCLTRSI
jgi:hypothetical protein